MPSLKLGALPRKPLAEQAVVGWDSADLVLWNICKTPCMSCRLWKTHEPRRLLEWLQTFYTHIRFYSHGWNNQPWIFSFLLEFALSMAIL
jgi:hypothetical protein